MKLLAAALVLLLTPALSLFSAEELTVATARPVVVETFPKAGADDVDPKTDEIKVVFSKDMADGGWSWVRESEETFPKTTGKPKYLKDKRTCVLPVKLEAGKAYAIWINTAEYENFTDADGRVAVPYLLVFQTKK